MKDFDEGNITLCDRNKQLTRMVASNGLSIGGGMAAGLLLTGPIGICVGVGACIAVALGDYFFGDKIASWFFKDDPEDVQAKHERIETEVLAQAYKMFGLTFHCTNEELREAFRAAIR
jgi:hypothetical protein